MNLKSLLCGIILANLCSCESKQRLLRGRRRAAGSSKIPYASLSAGFIPSRVRNRLRGNSRTSSISDVSRSGSEHRLSTNSDASSGMYGSSARGSQHGFPTHGAYVGNNQLGFHQQYAQQSGGRQTVPVGTSTFPYATAGIYSGPSQNRYSSLQLPIPSTYRGGQGYSTQQTSRHPTHQTYNPQQQFSGAGYGGSYASQGNSYGNSYDTPSYGNARNPQVQYAYGGYGQQSSPYGGARYDNPYVSGAIGSAYRDSSSLYTSYVHPQADSGSRLLNSYGIPDSYYSQRGSDGGSNYFGRNSHIYQPSNVRPSSGAYGTSVNGQDQQNDPYYSYGRSSDQSVVSGSSARHYGQSQALQYQYGPSDGNQYGPDASNLFGMGSQSTYDGDTYGQRDRYRGSYGSSMQSAISGPQSSNFPDYSGIRTGSNLFASSRQHLGSASSMQLSSRYSGKPIASNSREQTPSESMLGAVTADISRGSSFSSYFSPGQDDSLRNTINQYPQTARTISPPSLSRSFSGDEYTSISESADNQTVQRNPIVSSSTKSTISRRPAMHATPPLLATVNPLSQCQFQKDGLPDLTLLPSDLKKKKSIFLDTRSRSEIPCAVNENCLSKLHPRISRRLLLRFPTVVHNIGEGEFFPDLPPQNWIYHTCHKHYHSMKEFAHFFLYDENGTIVGEGHKVSFCLQDSGCTNPCKPKYNNCSGANERERPVQAISPGCYDDYKASLDCQWIDITGIPTNNIDYTLKIIVNPAIEGDRAVAERSYLNNEVACKITIRSDTELVVGRCFQVHPRL